MDEDFVQETIRQIESAPICEPVDGQFVDECHWSKTGWAIWNRAITGNYCTCRPALPPSDPTNPVPFNGTWLNQNRAEKPLYSKEDGND